MSKQYYPVIKYPKNIKQKLKAQLTVDSFDDRSSRATSMSGLVVDKSRMVFSGLVTVWVLLLACKIFDLISTEIFAVATIGSVGVGYWQFQQRRSMQVGKKDIVNSRRKLLLNLSEGIFISEPIDWSDNVRELVLSTRQRVNSRRSIEKYFINYLHKLPGVVSFGHFFPSRNSSYNTDIELILLNGLGIQIKIDEPYIDNDIRNCFDDESDVNHDLFFTGKGWIVIRFSERQVMTNPEGCCGAIAEVVLELTQDSSLLDIARFSKTLKLDARWSVSAAKKMQGTQFRERYLGKKID